MKLKLKLSFILTSFFLMSFSVFAEQIKSDRAYSVVNLYCPDAKLIEFLKSEGDIVSIATKKSGALVITYEEKDFYGKKYQPVRVVQASAGCAYESFNKPNPSKGLEVN